MARMYYRSLIDELNDIRQYMDYLFQEVAEPARAKLLPGPAEEKKLLPALRGDFKVDVIEKDDQVIVTADMLAGIEKKDITLDLIDPQSLEITCERKQEKKEEREGYYMHERIFGSMTRVIPLPKAVKLDDASATLKNGVLEVRMTKSAKEPVTKIAIQ